MPQTRRRGWLTIVLVVASVRVFAGAPDLDLGEHTGTAHSVGFAVLAEHTYESGHAGDAPGTHLHCHNCCAHAPMAVSSTPLSTPTRTPIVASVYLIPMATAPTFRHFRPPQI